MYNITQPNASTGNADLIRALLYLGALAFLPLAACATPAGEDTSELIKGQVPGDGEIVVGKTLLADINIKEGPHLVFLDVAPLDEAAQVGVYEFVATGHLGTSDFPELAKASPLELFLAATSADTEIPGRLLEADGAVSGMTQKSAGHERGWLRDAVIGGDQAKGYCTDSEFMAAVNAKGYNDSGTPTFRLNQTAGTSGYFVQQYYSFPVEGTGTYANTYYINNGVGSRWYNVDRYYTRVAVCVLGSHPTLYGGNGTVVHPGPTVSVRYRDSSDNPYGWAIALNHDYSTTGYSQWHFYTGTDWDWKTQIDLAADGDKFDIGHAIENL